MPFTLTMPKLSPTMEKGVIVKWHKQAGDRVNEGDLLFEVSTDKATVEHNAIDEGFLRTILVKEGKEATVNQAVAVFTEEESESIEGYQPEEIQHAQEAKSTHALEQRESTPFSSEKRGVSEGMVQTTFKPEPPLKDYTFEFSTEMEERIAASPLAKKIAKERGLDLSTVKGSGPHGRVMSRDIDLAQQGAFATFGSKSAPTVAPGSYTEEPLTPMRKVIAEKLQASKTFVPHFYVQQDIDVEKMIDLRSQLKDQGITVTFNDFIIRAAALALRQHPAINSGFNSENNTIIRFQTVDVAVAVSVEGGLLTPIIRHADYKNLGQISSEVKHLATLAKQDKLKHGQHQGGSFTLSNLGMYGIHDFQSIIEPPKASILAVGGIRECAVVKEGGVVPGKRMMLSISCDHRVIDGADAAQFLVTLQKLLQDPAILLI